MNFFLVQVQKSHSHKPFSVCEKRTLPILTLTICVCVNRNPLTTSKPSLQCDFLNIGIYVIIMQTSVKTLVIVSCNNYLFLNWGENKVTFDLFFFHHNPWIGESLKFLLLRLINQQCFLTLKLCFVVFLRKIS